MKTITTFFAMALSVLQAYSQHTAIPDVNFEKALIDLGYDSGNTDGFVTTASIDTISYLNISGKNIKDLNGIQDFKALADLNCSNNNITDIKLSNNTALQVLNCSNNTIASLNLNQNTVLVELFCSNNALTDLDLGYNTKLNIVVAHSNNLISLNIKNNNNTNIASFDARNNPSLTCIMVDNAVYSLANWTKIDAHTVFSENCPAIPNLAFVPDVNFEKALIDLGHDSGNTDEYVPVSNIDTLIDLDITGKNINDLTGIEYFNALEVLVCKDNNLQDINLTKNTALKVLDCSNNSLTALNLSQNIGLGTLLCNNNKINNLDLKQNANLNFLNCSYNNLPDLDLTRNRLLYRIYCNDNDLSSLNVKNGNNTGVGRFDARNNPNLMCIEVDDKTYSTANWINIDPQTGFSETCGSLGVDKYLEENITVYPNPTASEVHIDTNGFIEMKSIKTFDVLGRRLQDSPNDYVDLSNYKAGFYFLKMETNQGTHIKKIIKI